MKEELYGRALKLSPGFTRALYEIAHLYFSTSQFDAAEESLGLITDKRSKVGASACMLLGEIYLENGRFVQAIDVLKKAVSYGGTGKAHYLLSKAYYMAGDTGSASKELDISLKLDPSDIDARSFKKNLEQKK
jgi:tetratricopeptide (TPR) repeat protein